MESKGPNLEPPWAWGTSSLSTVIGGGLVLFLMRKRLPGLNPLLKYIMYFMAIEMIFGNLVNLVCETVMSIWNLNTFTMCTISRLADFFTTQTQVMSLMMISGVRFFIAYRANQTRTYNETILNVIIILAYLIGTVGLSVVYFVLAWNGHVIGVNLCLAQDHDSGLMPTLLVTALPFYILSFLTLVGDVGLLILIQKKKNTKVAPEQLVPWKSCPEEEEYSLTIPIHATSLSVVLVVVPSTVMAIALNTDEKWIAPMISRPLRCLTLWFLVMKCVRIKKPKAVTPPKGLQRHGEEDDEEEEDEVPNEVGSAENPGLPLPMVEIVDENHANGSEDRDEIDEEVIDAQDQNQGLEEQTLVETRESAF